MEATWWSIIPPLLAIGFAIATREVLLSLFIGIVSGCLILAGFSLTTGLPDTFQTIFASAADPEWNTPILAFALLLGGLTALLHKSGATERFGLWALSKVKSRRGAQLVTMFTGYAIFVDDYFNSLAVGQIARPITDKYGVSRAKLAYIIDSTAAPICVLIPLSSWGAYILSLIAEPIQTYGIGKDAFSAFLATIPANYYAITALLLVITIIWFKLDFSVMKKHEQKAQETMQAEVAATTAEDRPKVPFSSALDLILPILVMIIGTLFFFLQSGGLFAGGIGLMDAAGEGNITTSLVYGIALSIVVAGLMYLPRKKMKAKDFIKTVTKGMESMLGGVLILIFAWSLGDVIGRLQTGEFLSSFVQNSIPLWIIPAIVFVLSCLMAFSTGTSWGTFAIMIPISAAIIGATQPEWLLPVIGAVLAGAVFGDHSSPISDTTILSSIGADCDLMDHVTTQIPYALVAAVASILGYIVFGITSQVWLGLIVSIVALIGVVFYISKRTPAKE